jgi:hypothetical protein
MMSQLSHYLDAAELYWNSYILIYDSGVQSQLFRSAQDKAQSIQVNLRITSDQWIQTGQRFANGVAHQMQRLLDKIWFRLLMISATIGFVCFRYRKRILVQIMIWRLRHGNGAVNDSVVEEMFYRAARLAERQSKRRKSSETWREWMGSISDSERRASLAQALGIFERSKYGRQPLSTSDFILLEDTIREMKA